MQTNFQQPQDSAARFAACSQKAKAIVASYRAEAPTECDPQNIGQLGNDFDPSNANYEGNILGGITIGGLLGLIGLSAFAAIEVGAFFTYEAAAEGTVTTVSYLVAGGEAGDAIIFTTGTTLTAEQAAFVALVESGAMATEPIAVIQILTSWGFEVSGAFSLDALLALALYNPPSNLPHGVFTGPGGGPGNPGGYAVPPGFPDFIGGGIPNWGMSFGGQWACVISADVVECHLYF